MPKALSPVLSLVFCAALATLGASTALYITVLGFGGEPDLAARVFQGSAIILGFIAMSVASTAAKTLREEDEIDEIGRTAPKTPEKRNRNHLRLVK